MTLQINVDPSGLTQSQREALAGFILAYPGKECAGTCGKGEHPEQTDRFSELRKQIVAQTLAEVDAGTGAMTAEQFEQEDARLDAMGVPFAISPELAFPPIVTAPEKSAVLAKSIADDFAANVLDPAVTQLAQDDSDFDAAQAFGSTPAPLPLGAVAPSIAVAAPLPTALVATLATTSTTPPPVPPVPAPTTSVAVPVPPAPAAPTNPVDLDKNGLPWDYRIHAESKAKIADGTWRKKRNCDPALIVTVEAELRQLMGAPAPAAPGVAPSVPLPPSVPTPPPALSIPNTAPAISIPMPPTPHAPAAAIDPKAQFVQLVGKAAAAINAGKVTKEQVNACCAAHGVAQLVLLASRLDLVPTVAAEIYKLIGE